MLIALATAVVFTSISGDLIAIGVYAINEAAGDQECTSGGKNDNNTTICIHQKQQHSEDSTILSKSAKGGNIEPNLNHGLSMNSDHINNSNKKQDSKDTIPFILPFP